ncbi:hypothetical protein WJX82_003960 [Trebouxia sp. C0006]
MLVSPIGVKFVRALDTSGHEKSGDYIADKLGEVIDEIGPEHITAVIMDGAYNNVSANELLEERYPRLFTLHCTAHALDLALERICELSYFSDCVSWNEWGSKRDYRDKARYVNKAVLNAAFWRPIAHFCYVLKPIVRLLRLVDSNMPSMSKVYPECCAIETHIESTKMPDDVKQDVLDIFRNRSERTSGTP